MDEGLTADSEDSVEIEDARQRSLPRERGQQLQMERWRERRKMEQREGDMVRFSFTIFSLAGQLHLLLSGK